jgi:hypothetical protein
METMNDPNASAFAKAQALAKLSQLDPSAIIASAKNAVVDGIKDAVKDAVIDKLTGGLFGNGSSSGTPTEGASPAMVGISNQGGVTGAIQTEKDLTALIDSVGGTGQTAGTQNFGASVKSNVLRNLGIGG